MPDDADVDTFNARGSRFGLVKPNVNTFNVVDMFDNAAWLSAPPSKHPNITSKSEIIFTSKFKCNELEMVDMPPNDLKINNIPLSEFVRRKKATTGGTYNIGGAKTFVDITNTSNIMAKTFNLKTLNQFVNKRDVQNINVNANFNAGLNATDITGHDDLIPTVDGKNLTKYFHENITVLLALGKNKHFNTITIGPEAELKIKDKINDYNLKERVDQIVRTVNSTDLSITPTGGTGKIVIDGPITVKDNQLLTTIPEWGENFTISFELWIESYPVVNHHENPSKLAELLRFECQDNQLPIADCKGCDPTNDRIPGIFLTYQGIGVGMDMPFDNTWKMFQIDLKYWANVTMTRSQNEWQDFFEIIIDSSSWKRRLFKDWRFPHNNAKFINPRTFKNVKVYAADISNPIYPISDAKIKNLVINTGAVEETTVKASSNSNSNSVSISGDKVVKSAASLGPVNVSQINTAYNETTSTYDKSYVVTDFVNIKNPQSIPAGKTFSGAVKLADVSFLGSESNISTANGVLRAPPLTNCFIDVNSDDTQKVDRKVSFQEMTTSNLKIVKGKNKYMLNHLNHFLNLSLFRFCQVQCREHLGGCCQSDWQDIWH